MMERIQKTGDMFWMPQYHREMVKVDSGNEARCHVCRRWVVRGVFGEGSQLEIKCPYCKTYYKVGQGESREMNSFRCPICKKKLFEADLRKGSVFAVHCRGCKNTTNVQIC